MAYERTFSMLKPGVLQRRIVGDVISRIERKGLKIVALKLMSISRELCETHYSEHVGKEFYAPLVAYMTSGPVIAFIVEGESAISVLRLLCGPTAVDKAQPGTIRGDLAALTRKNIIHASDSTASADREIGLFFKPEEIIRWEDPNEGWYF
jgi:nucleoside-diphosphate kinase